MLAELARNWLSLVITTAVSQFLRAARSRSEENTQTLPVLLAKGSYGIAIGLLRQEIDTFVRLVYLSAVGKGRALDLIQQFAADERWTRSGSQKRITDAEMVRVATQQYFWVEIAYRFGCDLIHLSKLHDYKSTDPFKVIDVKDQRAIVRFLHDYHGYPDVDIDFARFTKLLPAVMNKISGKVAECCCAIEQALT